MKTGNLFFNLLLSFVFLLLSAFLLSAQSYSEVLRSRLDIINDGIISSQVAHINFDSHYMAYKTDDFNSLLEGSISVFLFKQKPEKKHFVAGDVVIISFGDSEMYKYRLIESSEVLIGLSHTSDDKLLLISKEEMELFLSFMNFGINPDIRLGIPLVREALTDSQKASLLLGELFHEFNH